MLKIVQQIDCIHHHHLCRGRARSHQPNTAIVWENAIVRFRGNGISGGCARAVVTPMLGRRDWVETRSWHVLNSSNRVVVDGLHWQGVGLDDPPPSIFEFYKAGNKPLRTQEHAQLSHLHEGF